MKKPCKKSHISVTNKPKSSNSKVIQQSQENKSTAEVSKNQRQNGIGNSKNAIVNELVRNYDEFHSVGENRHSSNLNNAVELNNSKIQFKGSFQGPIYYSGEIPEPKLRKDIINSKISKIETYLSLCEEFYIGCYSKSSSISTLFQYLIISHNIDSEEKLESLSRKHQSTSINKNNSKFIQKQPLNSEGIVNAETVISPLDLLTHPFRNKDTIDLWGPYEVILFECSMCKYGKEFDKIQRIIKTKTTKQIVDFYYCIWKRTNRYKAWKENRQFSERIFS
ncbi:hypothetical protein FG386_002909 [Cryptosporidium ryanae]|uniref:uncharacterized protein n=1 Tax=Cryptosporidium ryanae TaxID=515981 RepID=UPI00351A6B0E|nr:hypothetical protein FG386_002909 [Cryptosporidium ryanae]